MQMNHYKNNDSLAALGHGKWKSALRHTLLIIGMGLFSLGVYAQTPSSEPIPEGLKMKKTWVPSNTDQTEGHVVLETYVTGSSITVSSAVPNDIVIVMDLSGSMNDNMSGNTTRLAALKDAVNTFLLNVKNDAASNNVNHKVALVSFASGFEYTNYNGSTRWDWTNTALLTPSTTNYGTNTSGECQIGNNTYANALLNVNVNDAVNTTLTSAVNGMSASGGTCMQYGLEMALGILNNRTETTFQTPLGPKPRGQIVIFFTDGLPGLFFPTSNSQTAGNNDNSGRFAQGYGNNNGGTWVNNQYVYYNTLWSSQEISDTSVSYANQLKTNGATVFSVGIFNGANPSNAYVTVQKEGSYTSGGWSSSTHYYHYWEPSTIPSGEYSSYAAANGLLHMVSSNYDTKPGNTVGMATSWSSATVSNDNVANRFVEHTYTDANGNEKTWEPKYYNADNPDDLKNVFSAIANQSGAEPIELTDATVVQDAVSANFTLPEGTSVDDIKIWAPKCTDAVLDGTTVVSCTFDDTNDDGLLTLNNNGVVTGGGENRLPSSIIKFVNYDSNGNLIVDPQTGEPIYSSTPTKYIRISGFNFKEMFCGKVNGVAHGRKLVISIPLVLDGGAWGDGIETNGPLSFVLPDGGQVYYFFEAPSANVLGSVWTEVISEKPDGYDRMNIDSPEDLAWFISEVNGRIHYLHNNTVASNPTINGKLTADIDMSAHNWVPIGAGYKVKKINPDDPTSETEFVYDSGKRVKLAYEGVFDGNGHVITGLKNNADKWYKTASGQENEVVVFPGMFSNVKGNGTTTGIVHDVFILDSDFRGKYHVGTENELAGKFVYHGILADTLTGGAIYNCEAAGRMTCNNDGTGDANLIYGGLVGLNNGGSIYNCMAMPELTGYAMGGMIGENRNGNFRNGFTNGVYKYIGEDDNNAKPVGGIVAANGGTIDNCYVRFERSNANLDKASFGMLYGDNKVIYVDGNNVSQTYNGTISHYYVPQLVTYNRPTASSVTNLINLNGTVPNPDEIEDPNDNPSYSYTQTVNSTYYNMFTNDNRIGGQFAPYVAANGNTYNNIQVYSGGTPLLDLLIENRGSNGAKWKRTTAGSYDVAHNSGDINDDYPVLLLPGYKCLGSSDGIRIDYAPSLKEMLHRHNNGNLNENTAIINSFTGDPETPEGEPNPDYNPDFYKKTAHPAITGGAINLFVNDDVTLPTTGGSKDGEVADDCTAEGVVVYIDENISLLQGDDSEIEAYTGQTLQSFVPDGKERWHFVSSSLEDSQFGWTYSDQNITPGFSWTDPNPSNLSIPNVDEDHALLPIDLNSYPRFDFYCFFEPQYHWINFKRNSNNHWHMDGDHWQITYDNETQFVKGKGYLLSIDMSTWADYDRNAQFLQNRGTLNNGGVSINVTANAPAWTGLKGYNLLGNPYQSYLDFDAFVTGNTNLWADGDEFAQTYAVYDPSNDAYLQYAVGVSEGALVASQYLNMHQGFFIKTSQTGENAVANFTNAMRTNNPGTNYPGFRGEEYHYPLINFMLNDNEGSMDVAVLEVGRPENGGAKKLRVKTTNGHISLRYDNNDFAILFRAMTEGSQPLYFDTEEDGMFTLSWNTANADFRELTLVDNITGVRYDMLSHDHYVFEGHANDYKSRFKVVIGSFTGVEEEETVTNNFAFFDGSEWVVNGQGRLTVTDMMGRMVYSANLENDQNRVNLNGVAQGMYLMQVSNIDGSRVQKIVVR